MKPARPLSLEMFSFESPSAKGCFLVVHSARSGLEYKRKVRKILQPEKGLEMNTSGQSQYEKNLSESLERSDHPCWQYFYDQLFGENTQITFLDDPSSQMAGIDREILSGNENRHTAKEIYRNVYYSEYGDVALEIARILPQETPQPGWILRNIDCDFLLYVFWFLSKQVCYAMRVQELHDLYNQSYSEWWESATEKRDGFEWLFARNYREGALDFVGLCLCVPIDTLKQRIQIQRFEYTG